MLSGAKFMVLSCAESAMVKQPAWAAAINSSGFVPWPFSKRVVKEYGVLLRTPLAVEMTPLPSFRVPFQTAVAIRCMGRNLRGVKASRNQDNFSVGARFHHGHVGSGGLGERNFLADDRSKRLVFESRDQRRMDADKLFR